METAEEYSQRFKGRSCQGIPKWLLPAIKARDREVRRAALVEAAKANCTMCENGYRHTLHWPCQSQPIHDLIAALDAEVPHGG